MLQMTLIFEPVCGDAPAPTYTYTYPEEWTTLNTGCGTSIARRRTEIEACSARGGCDCSNQRAVETEEEAQAECATQWYVRQH